MIFLVRIKDSESEIIHFPTKELLAKYKRNHPTMNFDSYVIIDGLIMEKNDLELKDGRVKAYI